jgi:2-oxoglutarate ferredoxin oxidoreductase subunit gamma
MYPEQMETYADLVSMDATVFIDGTYTDKPSRNWKTVHIFPFTKVARDDLGNHRVANMVALGYLSGRTGLVKLETLNKIIRESVRREWVDINIKAIELGFNRAKGR